MSVVPEWRAPCAGAAALARLLGACQRAAAAGLLVLMLGGVGVVGSAGAQDGNAMLDRVRALEAEGLSLLHGHHAFEASLLSPDSDRLTVFLSLPHGARVILTEATLFLNEKKVLNHVFSLRELEALRDRASLIFYANRIAPGQHTIRLDVKTMQGTVLPMKSHVFVKNPPAKYIEIQIAGYEYRQPFAVDW